MRLHCNSGWIMPSLPLSYCEVHIWSMQFHIFISCTIPDILHTMCGRVRGLKRHPTKVHISTFLSGPLKSTDHTPVLVVKATNFYYCQCVLVTGFAHVRTKCEWTPVRNMNHVTGFECMWNFYQLPFVARNPSLMVKTLNCKICDVH